MNTNEKLLDNASWIIWNFLILFWTDCWMCCWLVASEALRAGSYCLACSILLKPGCSLLRAFRYALCSCCLAASWLLSCHITCQRLPSCCSEVAARLAFLFSLWARNQCSCCFAAVSEALWALSCSLLLRSLSFFRDPVRSAVAIASQLC